MRICIEMSQNSCNLKRLSPVIEDVSAELLINTNILASNNIFNFH